MMHAKDDNVPRALTDPAQTAALLRAQKGLVLARWEKSVCTICTAKGQPYDFALADHLPMFLDLLANALDPARPADSAGAPDELFVIHGRERAATKRYSLQHVLREYSILRQVLFSVLEERAPLTPRTRDMLLTCIDRAMQEAGAAFMGNRTALDQERRLQAEGKVRQLEEDQGLQNNFVSTLSHDLRGPLGSVKMALELLLEEVQGGDGVRELAEVITRNIDQAESLLTDLLDINRIKSGEQLNLRVDACDLHQLAVETLADLTLAHGPRFQIKKSGQLTGYWSQHHLRRVVENLSTNAVKYGDSARPVTLTLHGDGHHVELSVHNWGNPIAAEDQAGLFQPYFRTKSAEHGRSSGWGLGLTLVKGVATAHGGDVKVVSSERDGTMFTVLLPQDGRSPS